MLEEKHACYANLARDWADADEENNELSTLATLSRMGTAARKYRLSVS